MNQRDSTSIFMVQDELWTPAEPGDEKSMVYTGRVFTKNQKYRKWESQHLELYPDRLVRAFENSRDQCHINACYLKKIKYSESSFQPYKHGFRLHYGRQRCEFFIENLELFTRWQNALKRYTILTKFYKKYKLLCKQRLQEPYPASSYKAVRLSDNLYFQVRIIEKNLLEDKEPLMREIQTLRRIDHLYLQRIQEVYEDGLFLYIVYDQYAGREMRYLLPQLHPASERVIAECIFKLLMGLNHMHGKGIFHRDIKFDNVFNRFPECISDVCIVNFTSAEHFENKFHKRIGTPGFMAPEIFRTKQYDQKVDIYSMGVIFYYIVFGKMPFGSEFHEILRNNEVGEIDFTPFCRISASGLELMKQMLLKDPVQRCSAFQALNHHWFINLKIRELLGKPGGIPNAYSGQNLSTIIEKSDIADQSILTAHGKKTHEVSIMSELNVGFIDEFPFETVCEKMCRLESLIGTPSKHL